MKKSNRILNVLMFAITVIAVMGNVKLQKQIKELEKENYILSAEIENYETMKE